MYDAKMKLFEDCAAAVDNTLNKAGTDLYPYAEEFGAFFAEALQKWLKESNPFETKPKTAVSQGSKTSVTWHRYQLDGCPRRVFSAEGLAIPITETIVADEAEVQTGARPVRCEISKFSKDTDAEVTWIISFSREINKPFRLFAHSMASRQLRRQPKVLECETCYKFHGKRYPCNRKTCVRCARPSHDGECEKTIPKCVNCRGPHAATDSKCKARAQVVKGAIHKLDPMQLREVRKAGERARSRAFNEAKKAAAKLSNTNDDTSNVDAQVNMQLDSEVEAACQRQHDNTCETIVVY